MCIKYKIFKAYSRKLARYGCQPTLKRSVNVLCASLNSGVAKDSLGSSFFLISSSCKGQHNVNEVQESDIKERLNRSVHKLAIYLFDMGPHFFQQRHLSLIIRIYPLLKVRLRRAHTFESVPCQEAQDKMWLTLHRFLPACHGPPSQTCCRYSLPLFSW